MDTEHADDPDPRLAAAIAGLRDREPEADLWPGIARRIDGRRPGTVVLRWPFAAAAALALVAAGSVVTWRLTRTAPGTVVAVTDSAAPASEVPILPAGFDRAEATLLEAIDELDRAYRAEAATLDADVRRSVEAALAAIDSAIVQARTRAGASPTDVGAARYLTRTMQRKLHVLRTAATMARTS